jgi:ribosomal protein L19
MLYIFNILYVLGTIMAVKVSDPYAPGKTNRFVGTCIKRNGQGLRASFILRNIVDGEGKETVDKFSVWYNPGIIFQSLVREIRQKKVVPGNDFISLCQISAPA